MTVANIVQQRGITRVLHFTTNSGLLGILAKKAVLSRKRLPEEKYLEHIFHPNCATRQDPRWIDYVNLSVEKINAMFFSYSSKWHENVAYWCVLSFDPSILTHDNVVFVTTNNSYNTARRNSGPNGLEMLFAETVHEKHPHVKKRTAKSNSAHTTSPQAEVLYPEELSIDCLREVFVPDERAAETAHGQMGVFGLTIPLTSNPDIFK